tara:strand:- start:67 stop:375 length:309 start_codon:yes stop_codon:yes gene_type:complete
LHCLAFHIKTTSDPSIFFKQELFAQFLKCFKASPLLTFNCYSNASSAKSLSTLKLVIMDVGLSAIYFASNTIPTSFGTVAAAFAGAGSLLLIALRFVPEAKN